VSRAVVQAATRNMQHLAGPELTTRVCCVRERLARARPGADVHVEGHGNCLVCRT